MIVTWLTRFAVLLVCVGLIRLSHLVYAQEPLELPSLEAPSSVGALGADSESPPPKPGLSERFGYLDGNQDGLISRDEAVADPHVAAAFSQLDGSRDDHLDLAEFSELVIEPVSVAPAD